MNVDLAAAVIDDLPAVVHVPTNCEPSIDGLRALVSREAPLRHLLNGVFVSLVADAMTSLILAQLLVFGAGTEPGPDGLLRAILFATTPIVLFGPIAGALVDRVSRGSLLVFGHLFRAGLTLVCCFVAIPGTKWVGYPILVLLLGLSRVLYTCRSASIPHLVASRNLVAADSVVVTVGMVAGTLGAAMGSIATWTSPALGFVVATALHVYGVRWYRTLPGDLGGQNTEASSNSRRDRWQMVRTQLQVSTTRRAIWATAFHRTLLGSGVAVVVTLVDRYYTVSAPGYATTLGVSGVGSFLGALTAPRVGRLPWFRQVSLACALPAFAFLAGALVHLPAVAVASLALAAFAFQNLRVSADARVQRTTTDESVGRVFAVYDVIYNAAFASGAVVGLALLLVWPADLLLMGISIVYFSGAVLAEHLAIHHIGFRYSKGKRR